MPESESSSPLPENKDKDKEQKQEQKQDQKQEQDQKQKQDDDINALSGNRVGVEIEPDVKANRVVVQMCSCSVVWNCFSYPN
jgi:hypothetical protein